AARAAPAAEKLLAVLQQLRARGVRPLGKSGRGRQHGDREKPLHPRLRNEGMAARRPGPQAAASRCKKNRTGSALAPLSQDTAGETSRVENNAENRDEAGNGNVPSGK